MEELGIPELSSEQIMELCRTAEEKTREFALSKIPRKQIEKLDVVAEVEGLRPVSVTISVDIRLTPVMRDVDVKKLADDSAASGLDAAREFLREMVCQLPK